MQATRRTLLSGSAIAGLAWAARTQATAAGSGSLGEWLDDPDGLPAYRYTGPLRFGGKPMLPDDPWFLLGNHRLTLFAHASGALRWLSGEHGWATLTGSNDAVVTIGGHRVELVGMASAAAAAADKLFAIGSATYAYPEREGVRVTRRLSVRPSATVGGGEPALLVTIELHNGAGREVAVDYTETVAAEYAPVAAPWVKDRGRVTFPRSAPVNAPGLARFDFVAVERDPLLVLPSPHLAEFDAAPPSLWTASGSEDLSVEGDADGVLHARWSGTLARGATREFRFVVGHRFARDPEPAVLAATVSSAARAGGHAHEWASLVPPFAHEHDAGLRREMRWNAGTLEAMATWLAYQDETVVPQGSSYDYEWGWMIATRDLAQHALPLCTTRPALARSVIRYIFKLQVADGEIKYANEGVGWARAGPMLTSDQQLHLFLLVAEYLRATGDATILDEEVAWYPAETGARASGLDHLTRAFLYLRDRIGTGAHGLVRLWNSDWNDLFYTWPTTVPYNELFSTAESHMNSTMAAVVLGDLAAALGMTGHAAAARLGAAMTAYRDTLAAAFVADLGAREFPRRAYLGRAGAVGEDAMWLEPQGYALLLPELSEGKRRRLHLAVQRRLDVGEAMGARQIEAGPAQGGLKLGQRENGGFWYSLNGPLVLGIAQLDSKAAMRATRRMTFANYARRFPHYWTGAWTASDSLDASGLATEGLSSMAPWCAHAHAWPLYLWLRLSGSDRGR